MRLRWQDAGRARECLVPVMDEFGRLAAADLVSLGFDEAWWALMGFPAARLVHWALLAEHRGSDRRNRPVRLDL